MSNDRETEWEPKEKKMAFTSVVSSPYLEGAFPIMSCSSIMTAETEPKKHQPLRTRKRRHKEYLGYNPKTRGKIYVENEYEEAVPEEVIELDPKTGRLNIPEAKVQKPDKIEESDNVGTDWMKKIEIE